MLSIGSYVMYGSNGVCRIEEIRSESFTGKARDYFILSPVDDPKTTIYVPTDEEALTARMSPLLSREELVTLLRESYRDGTTEWINDPRARSEAFRSVLQSGDRRGLFRMLRTIHERREAQLANGKKLYAADENAFHQAERMLHGEIATILSIPADEVPSFIQAQLAAEG